MTATAIFPLAQWLEGTNQNSTPANDNALRIQAVFGPAAGIADAAPSTPADYDSWVVGTVWGGFTSENVVIYLAGTWKEFATYDGMVKPIAGVPHARVAGAWVSMLTGS